MIDQIESKLRKSKNKELKRGCRICKSFCGVEGCKICEGDELCFRCKKVLEEMIRMRTIKIGYIEGEKLYIEEEIPIPIGLWICDLCNSEIEERPIPVYCGYALCKRCLENLLKDYPSDEKEIEYIPVTENGEAI